MRSAILFGLWLLALPAAQAQTKPDLKAVLEKVSEIYKAATQYEFIGEATCHAKPLNTIQSLHILIAYKAPDKYRIEGGNPCLGPDDGDASDALTIHDGSTVWGYYKKANQYISFPASALTRDLGGDLGDARPDGVDNATMWRYRGIADVADQVKFVQEDAIGPGTAKANCYVVVVPPQQHLPSQTWWIDKATYHVLRIDDDRSSVLFTTIKLNGPLPDDLFKFTPPPGAKKIEPDQ